MPYNSLSAYNHRPWYLIGGHAETIIPSVFFKVRGIAYQRERLELPDGDFLDLDWIKKGNDRLMVITHGLEGNSERHYVKRTARYFSERGWDILAWNCRSCSGEMNRLPRFYHHGDIQDLKTVLSHAQKSGSYQSAVLVGYSMGGSMSIKLMGSDAHGLENVKAVVGFSVPCNLRDSGQALTKKSNRFYEQRFLNKLKNKLKLKAAAGISVDIRQIDQVRTFDAFHARFTAPLHGFSSIDDFYQKSTCDAAIPHLEVPTLVVNAWNDPLLQDGCYPVDLAKNSNNFHLETPARGGHVGFAIKNQGVSWMEIRTEEFFNQVL